MNKQNDGFGVVCVVQCDGVGVVQMGAPARFTGRSSGGRELCGGDCCNLDFVATQHRHEQFGSHALGHFVVVGRVVADGVAESMFPMLVRALHDSSKTYTPGFLVLIGLTLTGALIISFLPKLKKADS